MKKMLLSITLIFVLNAFANAQDFSIKQKILTPATYNISVDSLLIYELADLQLYLKQADIIAFIKNPKNEKVVGPDAHQELLDTLASRKRIIRLQHMPDFNSQAAFDSLMRIYRDSTLLQALDRQLYVVGAALMLQGKFMLYSNKKKSFITNGLLAKTNEGLDGSRTLDYYLPGRERFYYVITTSL